MAKIVQKGIDKYLKGVYTLVKMDKKWNKETLDKLYNVEGRTLQEIGDLYSVTRERIRQVMSKFGLVRGFNRSSNYPGYRQHYKTLEDYFENPRERMDISNKVVRGFLKGFCCSECDSKRNLHIHHIVYPATSMRDIQILCASCHVTKHRKNITYLKQIDIFNQYNVGISTIELAKKYRVSRILIYKIISKIRDGRNTIKKR